MQKNIYENIVQAKSAGKKLFSLLIDPDKVDVSDCIRLATAAATSKVDYIFIGGSLISESSLHQVISVVKEHTEIPVVIFPGSNLHIDPHADGILLLSVISGRNPEFLIGQHVVAAPVLRSSELEVISTGYMLIDSGRPTTVSYISNTNPIPSNKPAIAACTAMAGEMIGMKLIYLDGGSGADQPVPGPVINKVHNAVNTPLIVGGGIRTPMAAENAWLSGADMVIVGNGIEDNFQLLENIAQRRQKVEAMHKE